MPALIREPDLTTAPIDRRHARAEVQLDAVFAVELGGAQGNPFLRCLSGQVVFG